MAEVPVQVGPFRPVTVYDAPQVLFTQLFDGELRPDSLGRTLFRPEELTPSERDTFSERLANAAGGSKVVKALTDVALNPWAWFFFLTTPAGASRTASLFKLHKGYSPFVVEKAPHLSALGGLTSQQALRGTRVTEAVAQHAKGMEEILNLSSVQKAALKMGEVRDRLGLKHGFDRSRYAVGTKEWEAAADLQAALWAADEQAHMAVTRMEPAYSSKKAIKRGLPEQQAMLQEALVDIDPAVILRKYGAEELTGLLKDSYREVAAKVYDRPESVLKMWESSSRMGKKRVMMKTLLGDAYSEIRKGNITVDEFKDAIQKAVIDPVKNQGGTYAPRNTSEVYLNGKIVRDENVDAMYAGALRAGGSATPRSIKASVWHPDDLENVARVFGRNKALDYQIKIGRAMLDKTNKGKAVRLLRTDTELAANRYWKSNATTYSLFVQDIGDGVRRMDAEIMAELGKDVILRTPVKGDDGYRHRKPIGEKVGQEVWKSIKEVEDAGMAPVGGFNLADVVYMDSVTVSNPWTRETINKIVAPRMMGRIEDDRMFVEGMVLSSKQMVGKFLGTDAAKAIENASPYGAKFVAHLKAYSDPTTAFETARDFERTAVKTLYSAGLSANVPTAIINATQPFMLAGNAVGYDNLLRAYGKAFGELGDYIQLRASSGWKTLTTAERAEMLKKTHSMMNFEGEDLLEMAGGTLATLEGQLARSIVGEHTKHGLAERIFFEIPMTLFRNTELLNRNVVAHAVRFRDEAMAAKGVVIPSNVMKDNIRSMVRETQFGSHWMNMPQAFLPESPKMGIPWGRYMANPLIRQFMMYPVRTLGAWAYTVPRMAGRAPGDMWKSWLNDGVRAMAISAIGVEAAKNILGADMSKAGFVAGVTDLIPGFQGGRFDGREGPLPVPPVLDVAYNILKSGFTADLELFQQTLPRVVPLGAAISRALKSAPNLGIAGLGQSQYADWTRMVDGKVPVYKDDGTLIEMRNPAELIARGIGVDMGGFKDESQFMGFLVKQREQAVGARREYMAKLVGGNVPGAESVAREYERRFKVPLTVTRSQMRQFMDNRERPRVDRQLESLAEDIRPRYEAMRQATVGPSPRARPAYPVFGQQDGVRLSPEVIEMLKKEIAARQVPDQRNPQETSFERWGPFNLPDVGE